MAIAALGNRKVGLRWDAKASDNPTAYAVILVVVKHIHIHSLGHSTARTATRPTAAVAIAVAIARGRIDRSAVVIEGSVRAAATAPATLHRCRCDRGEGCEEIVLLSHFRCLLSHWVN